MAWPRAVAGGPLRIPAEAYNAMLDAAESYRGSRFRWGGGATAGAPSVERILVRNDSPSVLPAFSAVSLGPAIMPGDPVLGPAFGQIVVAANPASAAQRRWPVGLLLAPLAPAAVGEAVLRGVVAAPITRVDSSDAWAAPAAAGSAGLETAPCGVARVLGDNGSIALLDWLGYWQPDAVIVDSANAFLADTLLGLIGGQWQALGDDHDGPCPAGISLGSSDGAGSLTTILLAGPWAADGSMGAIYYAGPTPGLLTTAPPTRDDAWRRPVAVQITPRLRWLPGQTLAWKTITVQGCIDDTPQTLQLAGLA